MITPERFVKHLSGRGTHFYAGVPDSLLKQLSSHIMANLPPERHIITANEGAAVGVAIGHYLRTGQIPVVYMQNSGIGNSINPLLSLADSDVYGIPMLIIMGWRGQPGTHDEPQHVKQGRIMTGLIESMEFPFAILQKDEVEGFRTVDTLLNTATEKSTPVVLLVEKDTFFTPENGVEPIALANELPSREHALTTLAGIIGRNAAIVSTTGMVSRELFEYRQSLKTDNAKDFLTVGGMGHAASIAQGLALADPTSEVWCFDGDGALLMHAGTMAVIAKSSLTNFFHIVFNNGVHDSVGGQPTAISGVRIPDLAIASGYNFAIGLQSIDELATSIEDARDAGGPAMIEIQVCPGARSNLGRPTLTPKESKERFMELVNGKGHEPWH